MKRRCIPIVLAVTAMWAAQAQGYLVGPALTLDVLAEQSDLIVKVEAGDSAGVEDKAFGDLSKQGYVVVGTKLRVISVLKGDAGLTAIEFRHYDQDASGMRGPYMPQVYHLEAKRAYLLFARKSADPGVFLSFSLSHTSDEQQGLIRAANGDAVAKGATVKQAIWGELAGLLKSKEVDDVTYAIGRLDAFSNPQQPVEGGRSEFPRSDCLNLIAPMLARKDAGVVAAALLAVGRPSPYWGPQETWLVTVGKGDFLRRGMGTYPANYSNASGRTCRRQLVALANDMAASGELRAKAVQSLGRTRENERDVELMAELRKWAGDVSPEVRGAAAVLWADYPSAEAERTERSFAEEKVPAIRSAAAYAIGAMQNVALLPVLDGLLNDDDRQVSRDAAISLLSFDVKDAGAILRAHRTDERFGNALINALAAADPEGYRDELVKALATAKTPEDSITGQVPSWTSWQILMGYVEKCPAGEVSSGKMDKYLDALEKPPLIGSGPFQTLYTFYHERGMAGRMATFREKALKEEKGFDLDMYFKRIDGRE